MLAFVKLSFSECLQSLCLFYFFEDSISPEGVECKHLILICAFMVLVLRPRCLGLDLQGGPKK